MSFDKKSKWLFLLAGPNGAGKSTIYQKIIQPMANLPLVNADEIQKYEIKDNSAKTSVRAALIAGRRRLAYIKSGQSFVTETVFTSNLNNSIVIRAKKAGFKIVMYHVSVQTENLSVSRVKLRVAKGGHDVPEQKIRERFRDNKEAIRQAMLEADYGFVYDNSIFGSLPRLQLSMRQGKVFKIGNSLEKWCLELYATEIKQIEF